MGKKAKHCDCKTCEEHEQLVDEENELWDQFVEQQIRNRTEELQTLIQIKEHSKSFKKLKGK